MKPTLQYVIPFKVLISVAGQNILKCTCKSQNPLSARKVQGVSNCLLVLVCTCFIFNNSSDHIYFLRSTLPTYKAFHTFECCHYREKSPQLIMLDIELQWKCKAAPSPSHVCSKLPCQKIWFLWIVPHQLWPKPEEDRVLNTTRFFLCHPFHLCVGAPRCWKHISPFMDTESLVFNTENFIQEEASWVFYRINASMLCEPFIDTVVCKGKIV